MSVYKRGKIWVVQFNLNGKTHIKSSKSTKKKDAVELESKMRQELIDVEVLGHDETIKLYDAMDLYMKTIRTKSTLTTLETTKKQFMKNIRNCYVHDLSNREVSRWIEAMRDKGFSELTMRMYYYNLMKAIRYVSDLDYRVCSIKAPKFNIKKPAIKYLTEDEEVRILNELDPSRVKCRFTRRARSDARAMFLTMIDSGMRVSEASKLSWDNIDFKHNCIHLHRHKTDTYDTIPMTVRLRNEFEYRYKNTRVNDYVFPSKDGTTHKVPNGNSALLSSFKRAGVKATSHMLRKTFGTKLLNKGCDIVTVQHLLGHSSVKTTETVYAAFIKKDKYTNAIDMLNDKQPKLKVVRNG